MVLSFELGHKLRWSLACLATQLQHASFLFEINAHGCHDHHLSCRSAKLCSANSPVRVSIAVLAILPFPKNIAPARSNDAHNQTLTHRVCTNEQSVRSLCISLHIAKDPYVPQQHASDSVYRLCAPLYNHGLSRHLATPWHDVQSCAVDPGAVRSSFWKRAGPIMQWVANHLFAPNEDGCKTVVHAATDAWEPVPEPTGTHKQPATLRVYSYYLLCTVYCCPPTWFKFCTSCKN